MLYTGIMAIPLEVSHRAETYIRAVRRRDQKWEGISQLFHGVLIINPNQMRTSSSCTYYCADSRVHYMRQHQR